MIDNPIQTSKVFWSMLQDPNTWDSSLKQKTFPKDIVFRAIPEGSTPVFSVLGVIKTIAMFSGRG